MIELKEYHFTDEQIDQLLRLVRGKAFQVKYNPHNDDEDYDYNELANQIEDQIVNHPTNNELANQIEDQIATKFNTLTSDQIQQFVENYAEMLVDSMDTKTLMKFVYDTLIENLSIQSPDDILDQVSCTYDDETIEKLLESVTP